MSGNRGTNAAVSCHGIRYTSSASPRAGRLRCRTTTYPQVRVAFVLHARLAERVYRTPGCNMNVFARTPAGTTNMTIVFVGGVIQKRTLPSLAETNNRLGRRRVRLLDSPVGCTICVWYGRVASCVIAGINACKKLLEPSEPSGRGRCRSLGRVRAGFHRNL